MWNLRMNNAGLVVLSSICLIALKVLLIPSYTSTDFEVHRNWLSVTKNIELKNWYSEDTSEWTLDYPPLFAYFEWLLALIAGNVWVKQSGILTISKTPIFNKDILLFQRISVIATDLIYMLICALYSFKSPKLVEKIPLKMRSKARMACFILLAANQSLLIIDSIHFQYNSLLTAIFILSMYYIDQEKYVHAGFVFSVLVNFKHIYVYYALGFVAYYLIIYFEWNNIGKIIKQSLTLFIGLIIPFFASFGPFLYAGGLETFGQIIGRLFPISRGLTHAFWAPNFWALYNFLDMILYRLLKILKIGNFEPPTYTSGLVQEYSHSVLPNISTFMTLFLVIVFSAFVLILISVNRPTGGAPDFSLFAILASITFFYFGYHVHEKAIILITIPMTIFAIKDLKFMKMLIFISVVSSFTLFPLLFTKFEIALKYLIAISYFVLQLSIMKWFTRFPLNTFIPARFVPYFILLTAVEVYNTFIHKIVWGDRFEFFPLMLISVCNAIGISLFYFELVFKTSMGGALKSMWLMGKCLLREELIRGENFSVQNIEEEEEVKIIAGVDVSASKSNSDIVYISMSVFSYPEMECLNTFCDVRLLEEPYIPQYFAIREAKVVAEFIKSVVDDYPQYRPDVLLCDGFGKFHSRGCGMACHVGALTGIASIGIAKKVSMGDICNVIGKDKQRMAELFMENARKVLKENQNERGFVMFDVVLPPPMSILNMGNSMSGVFVSVGYGIELELSSIIVAKSLQFKTTCEPIRHADLSSRELMRKHFD